MFCTKCGAENTDTAEFCTSCGNSLKGKSSARGASVQSHTSLTKRDPIMILVFTIITFGIYGIYWYVKTKLEMNEAGADIPTAWLIIIPIISIWWMWKFSEGVEQVTDNEMSGPIAFLLLFLLGFIGTAIIQSYLNKVATD